MGSRRMKNSLLLVIAWTKFTDDVALDCEKLGGLSVNHKVYKCERK
jgi:hypothetical protein